MPIQLPPYDDGTERHPRYDYTITLDDVLYHVILKYKQRLDRWYLYLYDADDTALLLGKKLSINTPLLEQYQISGLPPGELVLWDTSDSAAECGYDDLGTRCILMYVPVDDIPAATTAANITIEAAP